jgi:YD repeat-containing protein
MAGVLGDADKGGRMRSGVRLASVLAVCCTAGVFIWLAWSPGEGSGTDVVASAAYASAAESASADNGPQATEALMLSSLVVPSVQTIDGGQQAADQTQVRHASPNAYFARQRSRTEFSHLGNTQAARVARESFSALIDNPAGGPPSLPSGVHVRRYISTDAAQLNLPKGKHAVVESLGAMAKEVSPGHFAAIHLGLRETDGSYAPASADVPVRISKRLDGGTSDPQVGVSLTPVNAQGAALGGSSEGHVEGASVFYPNTQTDTDTTAKPTSSGFEISSILRSVDSPRWLYYKVGMPSGARLVQDGRRGGVQVVRDGTAIGAVPAPVARDAAGSQVPVTMSVSGNGLALEVDSGSDEYQWPIEVDPGFMEYQDQDLSDNCVANGTECESTNVNWKFISNNSEKFTSEFDCCRGLEYQMVEFGPRSTPKTGEFGGIAYETQGESRIYAVETQTEGFSDTFSTAELEVLTHGGTITNGKRIFNSEISLEPLDLSNSYSTEFTICAKPQQCEPQDGSEGNIFRFMGYTTGETAYGWFLRAYKAFVNIAQEKGPEISFNTGVGQISSAENRENVMYGSEGWLGPYSGAFEAVAHDPGVGVAYVLIEELGGSFRDPVSIYKEHKCAGIQCHETYTTPVTYNPKMANGEHTFLLLAEDSMGLENYVTGTVKVDSERPYNLGVSGWSKNREISAAPHPLTIEATDGTKPTPSSGVRSIEVSIDGGAKSVVPGTYCSPGECTANGKYTLNAEGLTEGIHRLAVTATDNAGNAAAKEWTFDVRHASPVSVSPGKLDPTTGQFELTATDVSLNGVSGVSRVYQSRNLTAGAEGPLGSQWAVNLGDSESLTTLPEGSVVLTSTTGGHTTFIRNSKGEFESPLGDGSLKVEAKEPVEGKGVTEYLLTDSAAGTATRFTQPTGTESTIPSYANQFGNEGTRLNLPTGVALDAKGDAWVVDSLNNRIVEFSSAGTLLASYGSYGSEAGLLKTPYGIAINQSTGNVYVTDAGNNRVVELSSSGKFVEAFGWGVTNGKEEFEICTGGCRPGISGSGNGQFSSEAKGVAVDSSGNLWVVDAADNRVQEFNAGGTYLQKFGTPGNGEAQFSYPIGIAFSGGNLYVAEYNNDRVQELSTAGKFIKAFGKEGSGNKVEFKQPRGIAVDPRTGNLYVVDTGNNRVQEFTPAGALIVQFGSAGPGSGQFTEPKGVAVGSSGGIYVTDFGNDRVQEWIRPDWLPTVGEGPIKSGSITYAYVPVEVETGKIAIEPSEALAPAPVGVSCGTKPGELKKGCRALLFTYATKTTATGEGKSEWGEYNGHLEKVSFEAYSTSAKAMEEKAVAEYSYDKQGRLRAEWDPRMASALKTTYGYDSEGHVTAVAPPGREPWLMHYGPTAGDPNAGRLLSVARPNAATALWNGQALANTAAPTLSSSSPVIGTTLSVSSNGTWSNGPLSYSYQWEDCNGEGKGCVAIPGAVNQGYTPQARDAGYKLAALVTAENADGAVTASSAATTSVVSALVPKYNKLFGTTGSGQLSAPNGVALDAQGNVYVTDYEHGRVVEFSATGAFIKTFGFGVTNGESKFQVCTESCKSGVEGSGNGQFHLPWGIAVNQSTGNIYVVDAGNNRIEEFSSSGAFLSAFGSTGSGPGQVSNAAGDAIDANGNLWVADHYNHRVEEFAADGAFIATYGEAQLGIGAFGPNGIVVSEGNVYVSDYDNNRIVELSTAGKYIAQFGSAGTGNGQFNNPYAIGADPLTGDLYVTDRGNNRVEVFNKTGMFITQFGKAGTGNGQFETPKGIAVNSQEGVYVVDHNNNRVQEWSTTYSTNNPLPAAPSVGTNAVSTIEYSVPLEGTGVPELGVNPETHKPEPEKWGQTDDPTEATAIFPADEPMGWPASGYKRASITYMDEQGRAVNEASPSGGVSTTEYNETNEIVRTLSADDRVLALKEGSKSAEMAKALDTQSTYDEHGRLTARLGPEHKVKLAKGKEKAGEEVSAREHTVYSYDEGAPEGKTYNLLTKAEDAAEIASKEEFDKRTTKTSYSGQENLGWTLRKPTSTTVDAGGLNLVNTTVYEASTGDVIETKAPEGSGSSTTFAYSSQFGGGSLAHAGGDAFDGKGNLWVANDYGNLIDEFSSSGTLLGSYGGAGTGNGQLEEPVAIAVNTSTNNVYVSDSKNNRIAEFNEKGEFVRNFGSEGTGNGQFKGPGGIAIASGNVWVADTGNNRVEEFNEKGEFIKKFGAEGTGNGQFHGPSGVAFSGVNVYVIDDGNTRIEEFNSSGEYLAQFGSKGSGNGQFSYPEGLTADSAGNLYVADDGNSRIEEFTAAGGFVTAFGSAGSGNGQLAEPESAAISSTGSVYVADAGNNRIEVWAPQGSGSSGAHNTKTAYYTAEGESAVAACRNHPEWADLPCQTEPAAQPGTSGLPELPVTTMTYNFWDEVETKTEQFGSTTRTKTETYDSAGRALTSEATSTIDTSLPKVTNEYNSETGMLEKQSTTVEGKTKTLTNKYDKVGRLIEYDDADGNIAKYAYEEGSDGRLVEVSEGKGEEAKSSQTYSYDPTTGFITKLVDSAAGTFTATYDAEGRLLTKVFPNSMTASVTYNSTGAATGVEYVKSTHCATTCPEVWFSDAAVPSIHGETLKQTSTLSKESYSYDNDGRLTEVQETPTGKGCRARLYAYDEESNRTSQTTRESSTEMCPTEGGTVQAHSYDPANRLIDSGVAYETFGDMTKVPATDAGEHELTSSYYVDGQVASQVQNGETINYYYDPDGRTRETVSTGGTAATVVSHYAGLGETVSWSSEGSGKWTRNVPGIGGSFDATQSSTGSITLQIHDLQGNIVGTASKSETETKLLSTYNSTEFGAPNEGKAPPKYAWLGAEGIATELPATGVLTKSGASYVPQIALTLQTAQVTPPGAFPNGAGSGTMYVATISAADLASAEAHSILVCQEAEAARQQAQFEAELDREMETEGEDPTVYYNMDEAESVGKRLIAMGTLGEAANFLMSIPDLLLGTVESKLEKAVGGISVVLGWFHNAGEKLVQCSKESFVCKFSFSEWDILEEIKLVNLFSGAKVYACPFTLTKSKPGKCNEPV